MAELSEDTTLDVVDHLIAEGEASRIEQVALIEHLIHHGQSAVEAERVLTEIEDILAALRCRRSYLRRCRRSHERSAAGDIKMITQILGRTVLVRDGVCACWSLT